MPPGPRASMSWQRAAACTGAALLCALLAPSVSSALAVRGTAAALGRSLATGQDSVATILMIDDIDVTRPIFQQAIGALRDALNARLSQRTLLHVESLRIHSASARHGQRIRARIAELYAEEPIDLLIATGDSSVAVATRLRESWGRDIPIIGLLTNSSPSRATASTPDVPNIVTVRLGDMNSATVRNITALIPNLSELLIIGSTTIDVQGAAESMRPMLRANVRIEAISSPNLEDLEQRFARLGNEAAIVYLAVGRDASGRTWQVREYLRRLLEIAPRPVFGWLESYVGLGIVGGPVLDGATIGESLGQLASRILLGTAPGEMAPVVIEPSRVVYDWVPLSRFDIPLDRLPKGAELLNRPQRVWESYPRISVTVAALMSVLAIGIGFLLHNRRVVGEANAAQLAVSRRLLRAQDEERMRIARDLHDELGQEMTMLALEVSRDADDPLPRPAIADRVRSLLDRTREIAVGLHATHVGTMPFRDALSAHIGTLQARTGLVVIMRTSSWGGEPAPPVALAMFRSVQEAIQNVIRHADATQLTVVLAAAPRDVRVEIIDDGIGFEMAKCCAAGLGLASMRERMAAIGGSFSVQSTPFGGTTVVLAAPMQGGAT